MLLSLFNEFLRIISLCFFENNTSIFNFFFYALKERVLEHLIRSNTLFRVNLQHILHKFDGFLRGISHGGFQTLPLMHWNIKFHCFCCFIPCGPFSLRGSSQNLANFADLINFAIAWKDRLQHVKLSHNTSQSKNVNLRGVLS